MFAMLLPRGSWLEVVADLLSKLKVFRNWISIITNSLTNKRVCCKVNADTMAQKGCTDPFKIIFSG